MTTTSSDKSTAKSIDAAHQTSINDTPPEADMEFGRISIDEMTTTSSDKSTAKSIDAAHQTSINDTPPEAERERRVDSLDESPLAKIKESLDSLHSALEGQNQFGIDQIDDDTLSELEQRVDFVDNPTLKDRSRPIIPDSPNPESETPQESEWSNTEDPAIDLEEEEEELEDELEIDRQEGTNIDRPTAVNIDRKTEN
ncbi:hypothetical protein DY000_02007312 [Brassica cretica]|uniref:Uncharacterized protein n=1 Tax=Brassica cretica TaxID=69181 RepID=A0ABQ7BUB3_BRACR|nr:hypothetical protein DY000_02007312 [Brassica cretica]